MTQVLLVRDTIIKYYKKYEVIVNFVLKLIVGLFVFKAISGFGMWRAEFTPLFTSPYNVPFYLLCVFLFAILPPTLGNMLIMFTVLIQISSSLEVTFYAFILMFCIIVFYVRMSPKRSYLILAMILAFYFKMPYLIVLLAGLYFGLTSIIPIIIGTFVWQCLPFFKELVPRVQTPEKIDVLLLPASFISVYKEIFTALTSNFDWVAYGFVFAIIVFAVYIISQLSIPYSKDIAIGAGSLLMLISLLVISPTISGKFSFFTTFFAIVFSALIVEIARFFDVVLDYKRVERVQFHDDKNYYYVKIVPLITHEALKPGAKLPTRKMDTPSSERKNMFGITEDIEDVDIEALARETNFSDMMPIRTTDKSSETSKAESGHTRKLKPVKPFHEDEDEKEDKE